MKLKIFNYKNRIYFTTEIEHVEFIHSPLEKWRKKTGEDNEDIVFQMLFM
jgi:hypothetical protein